MEFDFPTAMHCAHYYHLKEGSGWKTQLEDQGTISSLRREN